MNDKEFMRTYLKNLYDYQETLMNGRTNKHSDASDKSITNSEEGIQKSPCKNSNNG